MMGIKINRLKSFSPLYVLFFIPVIPHFDIIPGIFHTDDLPILLFFLAAMYLLINNQNVSLKIEKYMYFIFFIFYLIIQNFFVNGKFLHSEILRFGFYLFLFIFISLMGEKKLYKHFSFLHIYVFKFVFNSFIFIFDKSWQRYLSDLEYRNQFK